MVLTNANDLRLLVSGSTTKRAFRGLAAEIPWKISNTLMKSEVQVPFTSYSHAPRHQQNPQNQQSHTSIPMSRTQALFHIPSHNHINHGNCQSKANTISINRVQNRHHSPVILYFLLPFAFATLNSWLAAAAGTGACPFFATADQAFSFAFAVLGLAVADGSIIPLSACFLRRTNSSAKWRLSIVWAELWTASVMISISEPMTRRVSIKSEANA